MLAVRDGCPDLRLTTSRLTSPPQREQAASPATNLRLPALDGLRAIAVIGVVLFHVGLAWIPGGLLGVDVFFVLSGFLITSILLGEHRRTGAISLRRFWSRRARRLLPALLLLLVTVAATWWFVAGRARLASLRLDVLGTLGYGANWRFAYSGQGYFDRSLPPSPLLHTWSLAVEEQFYLLWPLVLLAVFAFAKTPAAARRGVRWVSVAGAIASSGACAALAAGGVNTNRLYYGTDTRCVALLVGAALATLHSPLGRRGTRASRLLRAATAQLLGLAGLAGLCWAFVNISGTDNRLYYGGFLVVAVAAAAVIWSVVVAPRSPLARLLSTAPMRGIGRISYGIYLWHWPALLFLTAGRTGLHGSALLVARLISSVVPAIISWFILERPVLAGKLRVPFPTVLVPLLVVGLAAGCMAVPIHKSASNTPDLNALQALQREQERNFTKQSPLPPDPATAPTSRSRTAASETQSQTAPMSPPKPLRLMLEGDSVALTMTTGFQWQANALGVAFADRGRVGCGLWGAGTVRFQGTALTLPCPSLSDAIDQDWDYFKPTMVAVMVGRWEEADRLVAGSWRHIGDPVYDAWLSQLLDNTINATLRHGGKVALLTPLCTIQHEQIDGSAAPEDDPARRTRFIQMLHEAAERYPGGQVALFDTGEHVCPGGKFIATDPDGVTVRTDDGIHVTDVGAQRLAKWLLPQLADLLARS